MTLRPRLVGASVLQVLVRVARIARCLALSPDYEVPDESREGSIDPPAENLAEVTGLI